MSEKGHIAWRYDAVLTPAAEVVQLRRRIVNRLLQEQLADRLIAQEGKAFVVRLRIVDQDALSFYPMRPDYKELLCSLEINPAQTMEIRDYIDYRPLGWAELSQTALAEMRRRLFAWARRPLSYRWYLWNLRMARFEKRHFGRVFKNKGLA